MTTDAPSLDGAMRREIAERLSSFFVDAPDGRSTDNDAAAAVATSQGPHRERNEDRCAVVKFNFGTHQNEIRLAIICDGMGGMLKGAEAASLAMGAFISSCATTDPRRPLNDRLGSGLIARTGRLRRERRLTGRRSGTCRSVSQHASSL